MNISDKLGHRVDIGRLIYGRHICDCIGSNFWKVEIHLKVYFSKHHTVEYFLMPQRFCPGFSYGPLLSAGQDHCF